MLAERSLRSDLAEDPNLPDDTRLWAVLQEASGGAWGGCVYDVEKIIKQMRNIKADEIDSPSNKILAEKESGNGT